MPKGPPQTASRIETEKSIKHLHQTSHRMGTLPMLSEFLKWLELHGAVKERQSPNSTEIARYKVLDGFISIYRRANGTITMVNGATQLYNDFKQGRGYPLAPPELPPGALPKVSVNPLKSKHLPGRRRLLASRDGLECWFCSRPLDLDEKNPESDKFATVEELLARKYGGLPEPENQVIACRECNGRAGVKAIAEKVDMRERLRGYGKHAPRPVPVLSWQPDEPWKDDPPANWGGAPSKERPTWMTRLWRLLRRNRRSSS